MPYVAITAVKKVFALRARSKEIIRPRDFDCLDIFEEVAKKIPYLTIADNHRPEHPLIIKGKNLYQIFPGVSADNMFFADYINSDRYLTSALFDNLDAKKLPINVEWEQVMNLQQWLTAGSRNRRIIVILWAWLECGSILGIDLSSEEKTEIIANYLTLEKYDVVHALEEESTIRAKLFSNDSLYLDELLELWVKLFGLEQISL